MDPRRSLRRAPIPVNTLSLATLPDDSDSDIGLDSEDDEEKTPEPPMERTIRPLPRRAVVASDSMASMDGDPAGRRRRREEDEDEDSGYVKRSRLGIASLASSLLNPFGYRAAPDNQLSASTGSMRSSGSNHTRNIYEL
jgi:hypothetical protein